MNAPALLTRRSSASEPIGRLDDRGPPPRATRCRRPRARGPAHGVSVPGLGDVARVGDDQRRAACEEGWPARGRLPLDAPVMMTVFVEVHDTVSFAPATCGLLVTLGNQSSRARLNCAWLLHFVVTIRAAESRHGAPTQNRVVPARPAPPEITCMRVLGGVVGFRLTALTAAGCFRRLKRSVGSRGEELKRLRAVS